MNVRIACIYYYLQCQLDQKNANSVPRFLSEELLLFHGLIAVGTQEGHVYLW